MKYFRNNIIKVQIVGYIYIKRSYMLFDRVSLHGAPGFVSILSFSRLSLYRYLCSATFMCIVHVVIYLQLNRGSFESKHNCLMCLSLFYLYLS